jgi:TRAP-type C4-dicarboxylate transport system permease small subunit
MEFLTRLIGRIIDATTVIGAVAVALMMIQITADVVAKFVFLAPLPATITMVSNYYMVIVAFLPLAFVERRDGHITVEVVTEFMPARLQRNLAVWATALSAVVFALLTWRGLHDATAKYDIGAFIMEQGVKVEIWPSHFILPAGTALMSLVLVFKIIRYLTGGREAATTVRF